jgi:NSS family neurotransmitter:Na+ symporter
MGWLWWVRIVVPIAVIVTLYLGVDSLYTGLSEGAYF